MFDIQESQQAEQDQQVVEQPSQDSSLPPPSTDAQAPAEGLAPQGGEGQPIAPPPPAYTPNWKYKVMDKEHEIPEYLRTVVKDAETEKKIKELHEKAMGLDVVKPRFHETRETLKQVQSEVKMYQDTVNTLGQAYARGDMDTIFKTLNMDEQKVLQYFLDKANYNQLPPEQKQAIDSRRQAEQRANQYETELQRAERYAVENAHQAKVYGVQLELTSKPEVKRFADAFNERAGQPDAFISAVFEAGDAAYKQGYDLSPDQAIRIVMDHYGKFLQTSQPSPQQGAPAQAPQGQGQQPSVVPPQTQVIPNLSGKPTAPAKTRARSIEDLKAIEASM